MTRRLPALTLGLLAIAGLAIAQPGPASAAAPARSSSPWAALARGEPLPAVLARLTSPYNGSLEAISGPGRTAWAPGQLTPPSFPGGGPTYAFLRLRGRTWRPAASPLSYDGLLDAVSATRSGCAWAAGTSPGSYDQSSPTLAARWNGRAWSRVPTPSPGVSLADRDLDAVAAISCQDAWAAGYWDYQGTARGFLLHYAGHAWTVVHPPLVGPSGFIDALAARGPDDVWAAGAYQEGGPLSSRIRPLLEHFNGRAWQSLPVPRVGQPANIAALALAGRRDLWAVGYRGSDDGYYIQTLIMRWTGSAWHVVPNPSPPRAAALSFLTGVTAARHGTALAVGYEQLSSNSLTRTVAEEWVNGAWQRVKAPDPMPQGDMLSGVSFSRTLGTYAVGTSLGSTTDTPPFPLILHWSHGRWHLVPVRVV